MSVQVRKDILEAAKTLVVAREREEEEAGAEVGIRQLSLFTFLSSLSLSCRWVPDWLGLKQHWPSYWQGVRWIFKNNNTTVKKKNNSEEEKQHQWKNFNSDNSYEVERKMP